MLLHLHGIGGDNHFIGTEGNGIVLLFERSGDLHGVRAQRVRKLQSHVAQSAQADDAHLLAGAYLPMAQGRVGSDAGAEQRCNASQIQILRHGVGIALVDYVVIRIAAHGDRAIHAILVGIG